MKPAPVKPKVIFDDLQKIDIQVGAIELLLTLRVQKSLQNTWSIFETTPERFWRVLNEDEKIPVR